MDRTHLTIIRWDNCLEFWIGDIRGKESKDRFTVDELIEYLSGLYPIKTVERFSSRGRRGFRRA